MMDEVKKIIAELDLEPLTEEGGWFRRTCTGKPDASGRPVTTSIHALFTREQFSALHRLDADEVFFWNRGDSMDVLILRPDGTGERKVLGPAGPGGFEPMIRFEKGTWFGAKPLGKGKEGYCLITCVVTPGFVCEGFELGKREELLEAYPAFGEAVEEFTR